MTQLRNMARSGNVLRLAQALDVIAEAQDPSFTLRDVLAMQDSKFGYTLLHTAVYFNSPDNVLLLMARGSRVDIQTNSGKTPAQLSQVRKAEAQIADIDTKWTMINTYLNYDIGRAMNEWSVVLAKLQSAATAPAPAPSVKRQRTFSVDQQVQTMNRSELVATLATLGVPANTRSDVHLRERLVELVEPCASDWESALKQAQHRAVFEFLKHHLTDEGLVAAKVKKALDAAQRSDDLVKMWDRLIKEYSPPAPSPPCRTCKKVLVIGPGFGFQSNEEQVIRCSFLHSISLVTQLLNAHRTAQLITQCRLRDDAGQDHRARGLRCVPAVGPPNIARS